MGEPLTEVQKKFSRWDALSRELKDDPDLDERLRPIVKEAFDKTSVFILQYAKEHNIKSTPIDDTMR